VPFAFKGEPRSQMVNQSKATPATRLMLMTPLIGDANAFADLLAAASAAGDIAAVIARFSRASDAELSARARALLSRVQERNIAFLLQDRAELAKKIGADGAHLSGTQALRDGLPILKPMLISGAGGLVARHDAMLAAEMGSDYVMFGEPDAAGKRPSFAAIVQRVAWWAEIFEVPCVAYAETLDEISDLTRAGADFIALGDALWCDLNRVKTAIVEALARISVPERVN
jgi:thiamine-phosphate pyrophosphorylase